MDHVEEDDNFRKDEDNLEEDESPFAPLKRRISCLYNRHELLAECTAEFIGTFTMVMFGICSVSAAAIIGAQSGLWQVAVVWGFGVSLSIYATGPISGAHLNPSVSFAFALLRPRSFPFYKLGPYIAAQMLGSILAGVFNLYCFGSAIRNFETDHGITPGQPGSERSAMVFGEYFPNPARYPDSTIVSVQGALWIEAFGTGVLMFMILSMTSPTHPKIFRESGAPFFIGFTVASLISLFAPLTQAGWNPARDFGPRIVAAIAGYGKIAIPGPRNGFWIYIVGPMIGAPIGGAIRDVFLEPAITVHPSNKVTL